MGSSRCLCGCGQELPEPAFPCRQTKYIHGHNQRGTTHNRKVSGRPPTHGYTGSKTYASWQAMRSRCLNATCSDYPNYGKRGIRIDPCWDSFEQFLADMGERPDGMTLDRIDNDGDYEPGNCRWATAKEQRLNQRSRAVAAADRSRFRAAI